MNDIEKGHEYFRERYLLAEFEHWELLLYSEAHPYLCRSVAWAKRGDATRFLDMNEDESEELRTRVIPMWFEAVRALCREHGQSEPYRENVSILGNAMPHLHVHLIPRYEEPIELFGVRFVDPRPHRHYKTYEREELPEEMVQAIRSALIERIEKIRRT